MNGTKSRLMPRPVLGSEAISSSSLVCLTPWKPIRCANRRASRRFEITTFSSPLADREIRATTPNSSSSSWTSRASRSLRVEYEI